MERRRKICVVTGTRAEYGLLFWLMKEIDKDNDLELLIIVTGMHLSSEFGLTYQTIENDGFKIDEKVEMLLSSDTPVGIAKSIGLGTIGFADALDRLKPDILVILGDRYEVLAAAQAAMVAKIPIAHMHGGETTEGAMDEAIRHALTKMAQIHFVSAEIHRHRVIQLGEKPDLVLNYGAPGLDNIANLKLLDKTELMHSLDFTFGELNFLVTYHPVTLAKRTPECAMQALLDALGEFPEATIIFTKPNSDTHGRVIIRLIDEYAAQQPGRVKVFTSLGQLRYLSVMKHSDIVIGNSSSGLIEAPLMKKPTVNIGERQSGRLRASSVLDAPEEFGQIVASIQKALSPDFQNSLLKVTSPYGDGHASPRIKEFLKKVELDGILIKKFCDINFEVPPNQVISKIKGDL